MLLTENSLVHLIGQIFHPVFVVVATVLAWIYGVIPNYAIAITLLTILIMAALTPLTVKSTKSMLAMQRLQPEITKLRQKYKGPENREQLNQELMRVYKEQGVNPAGSCLPMFLQMPFLIVLYDVIRGLSNTIRVGGHTVVSPRYIPTNSRMYHDLVHSHGAMKSFGVDLSLKPFSHHVHWYGHVPFFVLVAAAVLLQYLQMSQMSKRNPAAMQANPQMQKMQKIMPIFFAYIYFLIPAAVVIYMIVSSAIRIGTQDVMFRTGMVQPVGSRAIPARSKVLPDGPRRQRAAENRDMPEGTVEVGGREALGPGASSANGRRGAPARGGSNGKQRGPARTSNGSGGATRGSTRGVSPKPHPRAKNKRARKAR